MQRENANQSIIKTKILRTSQQNW